MVDVTVFGRDEQLVIISQLSKGLITMACFYSYRRVKIFKGYMLHMELGM